MTSIEQIEQEIAEHEQAAKEAAKHGMFSSGATLRNRAAGMNRALQILQPVTTVPTLPEKP